MSTARVVTMVLGCLAWAAAAHAEATDTVWLRGHPQLVHLYGHRGGAAAIVSSGDGGWVHLGPHVAATLAARGFFVVGFDVKAYLVSFTNAAATLRPDDEPADFRVLVEFAAKGNTGRPVLIGVSEGAGLSVMAATDPDTRARVAGVIGLGLPDVNELGWRWRDAVIYVTHGVPNEPTFSTAALIERAAPLPIAAIESTRDEYVAPAEIERVMAAAREPKRLWRVEAADHRFSDNLPGLDQTLFAALAWLKGYDSTS